MKKYLLYFSILIVAFLLAYPHEKPENTGGTAIVAPIDEESTFAEIDPVTGDVLRVIVIDQANLDTGKWGDPKNFVRSSNSGKIRKNGASVGYKYDKTLDAFIPPKPNASAVLDMQKAQWIQPAKVTKATST